MLARMFERFWHGCGNCRNGEGCALAEQLAGSATEREGPRPPIAVSAGLVFLLPLAIAIGFAALVGRWVSCPPPIDGLCQLGGLLAGFATGVVLARAVIWGVCRLQGSSVESDRG